MCEQVRALMCHTARNVAGQTHLGTLAALIERLHLFISNDSGPAHLAAALGTPSITIFGAANVQDWAAIDTLRHRSLSVPVPCRPCYLSECPTGKLPAWLPIYDQASAKYIATAESKQDFFSTHRGPSHRG